MQLEVEAARIADGITLIVASPERRRVGLAVGTDDTAAAIVGRRGCLWLLALGHMASRLNAAIAGAIWTVGPVRALAHKRCLAGLALDLLQAVGGGRRGR